MAAAARQAILILGMHRSGTSAMAGISHLLGGAAPAGMMAAAFDNPTGFWESFPISALNEGIFIALGHNWFDAFTFDSAMIDAAARQQLIPHCTAVLAGEYGDAPLLVLKDPRFSLLLDLWLPAFTAADIAVASVLALRHPAEATSSMRRRDNMPIEIAAPMWLHYTLEAERLTRGLRRCVISYDRVLQDWGGAFARIAAETGIVWPRSVESAGADVDAFLRPHMRHHHAAPGKTAVGRAPVAAWVAETYDAMRKLEAGEGEAQYQRLDRVRTAFAGWRAGAPRISLAQAAGKQPYGAR